MDLDGVQLLPAVEATVGLNDAFQQIGHAFSFWLAVASPPPVTAPGFAGQRLYPCECHAASDALASASGQCRWPVMARGRIDRLIHDRRIEPCLGHPVAGLGDPESSRPPAPSCACHAADSACPLAIGGLGRPAWRFRLAADLLMDNVLGAGMSRA